MSNYFIRMKLSACALTASLLVLFGTYTTTAFAQDEGTNPEEKQEKVDCDNPDNAGLEECEPNEEVVVEERYGYSDNENPREAAEIPTASGADSHSGGPKSSSTDDQPTEKPTVSKREDVESNTDSKGRECAGEMTDLDVATARYEKSLGVIEKYEDLVEEIEGALHKIRWQNPNIVKYLAKTERELGEAKAASAELYGEYVAANTAYNRCIEKIRSEMNIIEKLIPSSFTYTQVKVYKTRSERYY